MKLIFMLSHKIQSLNKLLIFSHTAGTVLFNIKDADSYVKDNFAMPFKKYSSVTLSKCSFNNNTIFIHKTVVFWANTEFKSE